MANQVLDRIYELSSYLEGQAIDAEELGRLPDETAKRLKEAGTIRMLQPRNHGGYEADPREFFEVVMATGARCGASGWVSGVVGVHPWEMALCDPRLQDEVWGDDPDTWIASPYAPMGKARAVDDGFIFNGHWQFSSGTDFCDWIFLGGLVTENQEGTLEAPEMRHFVLPRSDYEIVADSWKVMGLKGSGSKDIIVQDAYVPLYRTIEAQKVVDGRAAQESGRAEESALYRMPWSAIFPVAITASVIGICEGALATHVAYQKDRVSARGKVSDDPWLLSAIGEAASEIHASRVQLLSNVGSMYEIAERNEEIPVSLRAQGRRDQARGSWRAVSAVDEIFARSGGGAIHLDNPIQRFWRDAHAGLNHIINVAGPIYSAYAAMEMGIPLDGLLKLTV